MNGRDLVRSVGRGGAERGFRGVLRWGRAGVRGAAGRGAERARTPGPVVGIDPGPGGGMLRFARARLEVRVTVGGAVFWGWDGAGPLPSYALAGPPPEADPRVLLEPDRDEGWRLVSERLTLTVSRVGTVEVRTPGGELLRRDLPPRWWDAADGDAPPRWTQRSELAADARFFGLGGQASGPRLRDGTYRLRNALPGDPRAEGEHSAVLAAPVQWVVADAGTHLAFHDCAWDGRVTLREGEEGAGSGHDRSATSELRMDGGPLRCWVVVGTPARIAYAWATLTGRAALPPPWALGHHLAVEAGGAEAVGRAVTRSREDGLPVAAVHVAGGGTAGGLAEEARRCGVRLVTPVGEGSVSVSGPVAAVPVAEPADGRTALGSVRLGSVRVGAGGDGDGNDDVAAHNAAGLLAARSAYERLAALPATERPFVLAETGWVGLQRYGGMWFAASGEDGTGLREALARTVGLGLCGVPYAGPEVAGPGSPEPSDLALRGIQLASFTPHFRTRAGQARKDVRKVGERTATARDATAAVAATRARLLPYLVTLMHVAHRTGAPVVRPLWWESPEDRGLRDCGDAFLLGDALLVAPVLAPGAVCRAVRLPAGRWYDTATEEVHEGPGRVLVDAPLSRTPVLARAGAVIPVRGEDGALELEVWPPEAGRTGSGLVVPDTAGTDGAGEARGPGRRRAPGEPELFTVRPAGDGSVRVENGDGKPTGLRVRVRGHAGGSRGHGPS